LAKVDCPACHHVALLTPEALSRLGLRPMAKVLDLALRSAVANAERGAGRWCRSSGGRRVRKAMVLGEDAPIPFMSEPQVKKSAKPSKTIRANKCKAKLRTKHHGSARGRAG